MCKNKSNQLSYITFQGKIEKKRGFDRVTESIIRVLAGRKDTL